MALFETALDVVSPENWESLDIRVLLYRSTGSAPTLSETSVAALFSGGVVELSDTAYVRKTLSGLAVVSSGVDRRCDADSVTWTALGGSQSARGVVVYAHDTDDAGSVPLVRHHFTSAVATTGQDFSLAWHSTGLIVFEAP